MFHHTLNMSLHILLKYLMGKSLVFCFLTHGIVRPTTLYSPLTLAAGLVYAFGLLVLLQMTKMRSDRLYGQITEK